MKFYNVDILCPEKIAQIKSMFEKSSEFEKFSIATTYRLVAANLIDEDKIIYLDSDTVVNLDIKELWQVELENKPLASVAEIDLGIDHSKKAKADHLILANKTLDYRNYFCAGILMLNLKYLRANPTVIDDGMKFIFESGDLSYFDQDILNYCFSNDYIHLPEKFDVFVDIDRARNPKIYPAIYHYVGRSLSLNPADIFNKLWLKYFVLTPFFNEEILNNLYVGIQQLYSQQKKFAIKISEIVADKKRAFFVSPPNLDAIKNFFNIKSDEEIILAESPQSLEKLVNSMQNSSGKKVFFLAIFEFPQVYKILTDAGFTPGKDFLNAFEFLSDAEGVPFNSHFLVRLL